MRDVQRKCKWKGKGKGKPHRMQTARSEGGCMKGKTDGDLLAFSVCRLDFIRMDGMTNGCLVVGGDGYERRHVLE